MADVPFYAIPGFDGIDNVNDPHAVPGTSLLQGRNVDLTNNKEIILRPGATEIIADTDFGTLMAYKGHNLISKNTSVYRLCLERSPGSQLDLLASDILSAGKSIAHLGFYDEIVFSDAIHSWIYNLITGQIGPVPVQSEDYKRSIPPFQLAEYYHSRYYFALDNVVWYTDVAHRYRVDARQNFFQFPSRVTMMKAVDDGMYFGTNEKVYYANGNDIKSATLQERFDAGVLEGSAQSLDSHMLQVPVPNINGKAVFALTTKGFIGLFQGGFVINYTEKRYLPSEQYRITTSAVLTVGDDSKYVAVSR